MPPLAAVVEQAQEHAFDARAADATEDRALADRDDARSRLLPSFTATGSYAHNQYDAIARIPDGMGGIRQATLVAHDQLDASFTLNVPLVDLGAIARLRARNTALDAARLQHEATLLDVTRRTTLAYYDLAAAIALAESAERSETVARESLRILRVRLGAGIASELDVARSEAEAERRAQLAAEARRRRSDAQRALELFVGGSVDVAPLALDPSLDAESPLETWLARAGALPSVLAADASAEAARADRTAARAALLPTVTASASERYTSAPGFSRQPSYQIGVRASWTLDFGLAARAHSASAAQESLDVAAERVRAEAENAIASAWHAVDASRQRVVASRASHAAADRAVAVARIGREAGTTTQLELDQAERDAFEADVAVIESEASLAAARAQLRILAGEASP